MSYPVSVPPPGQPAPAGSLAPPGERSGLTSSFQRLPYGNPLFGRFLDLVFVCGGFSLPFLWIMQTESLAYTPVGGSLLVIFVLFNFAHFASSTVASLYQTGRGRESSLSLLRVPRGHARRDPWRPSRCPSLVGRHFMALTLTWSPYHYAAQAYGLAADLQLPVRTVVLAR